MAAPCGNSSAQSFDIDWEFKGMPELDLPIYRKSSVLTVTQPCTHRLFLT